MHSSLFIEFLLVPHFILSVMSYTAAVSYILVFVRSIILTGL